MEFLIEQSAGNVSCNFEEIKAHLDSKLDEYRGIVFTEESKKDAKNVVAELRKEKKAFSDRVKAVKTEYMRPWEEFNGKANELLEMFDEPIYGINAQITEFEKKRIEEKKILIAEIYMENVPKDLMVIIPAEKIYNSKWENATYTRKQITDDIKDLVKKVSEDVAAIKGMHSEAEEKALTKYAMTLTLIDAINIITAYENQKAEILARQQEKELEKAKLEAREALVKEQEQAKAIEEAREDAVAELIPDDDGEVAENVSYIIKLTPSAKKSLEMYMDSIGIEYDEMPF